MTDRGIDRGTDRGIDRGTDRGTDQATDRGTDRETDRGTDQATDRGTDQATDRETDRGTDRETDRGTDRETDRGTAPVRLLLADDEHLIRGALATLLSLEDDLVIVAEAATGPEALAMARAHEPDVAVLDLQMPGADGVKVATSLRAELPGCQVLIVTSHGRPGHLKRALAAGVRGFVPKTVSAQRLAEIIRTVHAGSRYVDPELAADAIAAGDSPLTAREAEVLELAADGAPVAEIAERAALSQGTVRNYLSSAVSKLGAENRHAAVRLARERGWV